MKSQIFNLVLLSILATPAFAAPTFYGEIDTSIDYLPEKNATKSDKDVWEISSNSSFLGLKGEEKLTEHLSAIYTVDWGISSDGDGVDWFQRNRFIGLKDTRLGTIKIGKNDTPVKQLSLIADTFNNYVANKADMGGIFTGENRVDNVVIYESPALKVLDGTFKWNALLATGEASGIKQTSGGAKVAGGGLGDAWSTSVTYEKPLFSVGLGYDKAIPSTFLGRGFFNAVEPEISGGSIFAAANTIRAVGKVNLLDGLSLKALYQSSEVQETPYADTADAIKWEQNAKNIDDTQGWLIGAEYTLPNAKAWTIKGQYSQNATSFKDNTSDFDAKQIMGGIDYAFNKQVKTYGYAGYLTFEQSSKKDKQPVAGLGLEFKF